MTKRTKRFFAGLLTASMLVGMYSFAYADDGVINTEVEDPNVKLGDVNVKGESVFNSTKIDIVVPTKLDFIVNPFGNEVTTEDQLDVTDRQAGLGDTISEGTNYFSEKKTTVSGSIISPTYEIKNNSAIDIDITLEAVSANSATVDIVTSSAKKQVLKSAYIFLQLGKGDKAKELFDANAYSKEVKDAAKGTYQNNDKYNTEMKTNKKIVEVKLPKCAHGETPKKGTDLKKAFRVEKGTTAYIKVNGDVNANPLTAKKNGTSDAWKESDKINLSYKMVIKGFQAP